jgi:hypothetical protein
VFNKSAICCPPASPRRHPSSFSETVAVIRAGGVPPAVSAIGFEGYEKRLEISFSEAPVFADTNGSGLRALSRAQIGSVLHLARCTVVSELSNEELDSYVLSESSLFVYPHKVVIRTCGTAKLLLAVPRILELAEELSLPLAAVKYSRGTFMFPDAQPSPHKYFAGEVSCLLEPLLWGSQVWWQRLCGWRCCKTWPEMARLLCHRVPRRRQACGHS